MKQLHGESIDQFTTRLRQKAKNCEFSDIDSEIKSQIIQGVVSQNMRMQCLQDPDKSLNDLLTKMRTMEISKSQPATMSKDESSQQVVRVKSNPRFSRQSKGFAPKRYQQRSYQTIPEASNKETLISYELSVELGILPQIQSVHKSVQSKDAYSGLIEEYSQVFTGLGCLKDRKVKFHIDKSVVPVAQTPRRVPFHVRAQVENELKSLEEMDVIEKVIGLPTPWVSNLVAAPKPNAPHEVRVCVDMRKANTAIKTEKNVCPTVDDIILTLNGATVFSRLDLYKAFHQIELDEASRVMTTFQTHIGLFSYKSLNFGVSAAPLIFQNELRQALQGLKGILNIADDIVCFGKTQEEHDANLRALLQRLQDRNLTLNSKKCSFGQSKIQVLRIRIFLIRNFTRS
ncbi:uncharacterized protein K02A2.6-like [Ruditapes philippinarum]|uniref:uncharacterized protein K02A2.6-like n=1 Tax=Ruditapes philippinarum TaxID=129788 RepID=UPI00295B4468|nr:uncharacterized protein K02A2.6-like [Ruditapes philippinarum]